MSYQSQASRVLGPSPGLTTVSVTDSSTAAQDLSQFREAYVGIHVTEPVHIRFGDASVGAATSDDLIFDAGVIHPVLIVEGRDHYRALRAGGTSANLRVAQTGD